MIAGAAGRLMRLRFGLAVLPLASIILSIGTPEAHAAFPSGAGIPAYTWSHNLSQRWLPTSLRYRYPRQVWLREIEWMLSENGSAGSHFSGYYALPFSIPNRYGLEPVDWRTDSTFSRHFVARGLMWDVATEAGGYDRTMSPLDPCYLPLAEAELRTAATAMAGRPYVSLYEGLDEPRLAVPSTPYAQWPSWLRAADDEIRDVYGYGRYSAPRPMDDGYATDPGRPFRWIAFNRWAFDRFLAQRASLGSTLRSIEPSASYVAADLGFIFGMPAFDFARWGSVADVVEADPYVGYLERATRGRGRYNHGFAAKFLSDLTGKPVRVIVQAFPYFGTDPTTRDLADWTSQSLHGGADMISYYALDNPRFTRVGRYVSILALTDRLKHVDKAAVEVPVDDRLVLLWSASTAISRSARPRGDAPYSAYVLFGPMVGSRFRFVSDTQLERGDATLAAARVVVLPEARYLPRSVMDELARWTAAGGTLLVGDPWAFEANPDGSSTIEAGEEILAVQRGGRLCASSIRVPATSLPAGHWLAPLARAALPLYPLAEEVGSPRVPARSLPGPLSTPTVTVLASYNNEDAAVIERPLGAGRIIFTAASPFTPLAAVSPPWRDFFSLLLEHEGLVTNDPRWEWRLTTRWSSTLRLHLAKRTFGVRRGGIWWVRWKVTGTLAKRAALTAHVRLPRGRTSRLELGWAPTARWVSGSAPLRLPAGRYRAIMRAVALDRRTTARGYPVTLIVR